MEHGNGDALRFTGGMNLARPGSAFAVRTSPSPFARLSLGADNLGIEPRWLFRRRLPSIDLPRREVEAVYRATDFLGHGIAVWEPAGTHYFWTYRSRKIVAECAARGYPTEPPRRAPMLEITGLSKKPIPSFTTGRRHDGRINKVNYFDRTSA